jgi:hypothetical protein
LFSPEWEYNDDDIIVRRIDQVTEKAVEDRIESDIQSNLKSAGINANRISRGKTRTSDYEDGGIDFEVTIVQAYIPNIMEIDNAVRFLKNNPGYCQYAYMYLGPGQKPVFKIIETKKCDPKISLLCIGEHISIYRNKIVNKIEHESSQNTTNPHQIIVLDFRLPLFDHMTLRKEISSILNQVGEQYPSLLGVVLTHIGNKFTYTLRLHFCEEV